MTIWWLVLVLATLGAAGVAFVWLAVRLGEHSNDKTTGGSLVDALEAAAENDADHIFDNDFRQELRNRGRLHFEKIINENAMFLQQDLRLTTSQLNDYMKNEITTKLKEEFDTYEQSITDAKTMAIESLEKTKDAIEEQRQVLSKDIQQELQTEKAQLLKHFETNMTSIINHYLLAAIGNQIDLNDQLEYILADLEANKKAIIEDIQSGA